MNGCDVDWDQVDLVVFDVDGTLYDQRPLRLRMGFDLLRSLDLSSAMTIFIYRRTREKLGEAGDPEFATRQFDLVARRRKIPDREVRRTISEWMEERPLAHIRRAAVPGVFEFFGALRASGRRIAVFSDYPATQKLGALGLRADIVVSSTDENVARLKPDPAGLRRILDMTGIPASRALMIGDRADRDGAAARRLGVQCLIRTSRANVGFPQFRTFKDEIFAPVLRAAALVGEGWTLA